MVVHVQTLPVPAHLLNGDYANDPQVREAYSVWVKELWLSKDLKITEVLENS